MSITRIELRERVGRALADYGVWAQDTATGDAVRTIFRLSHEYITDLTITDVTELLVESNVTAYTLDANNGTVIFTAAPGDLHTENFLYKYWFWSESYLNDLINEALEMLQAEYFKWIADTSLTGNSLTKEFLIPSTIEKVTKVEIYNGIEYKTSKMWHTTQRADGTYLLFRTAAPGPYTLRLTGARKVLTFTDDWIDTGDVAAGNLYANTTDPLTVAYVAHGFELGDIIKMQSEYMDFLSSTGVDAVTFSRGDHKTTAATHANGVVIYRAATLDDVYIPDKTASVITAYVVWQCFEQRIVPRLRDNTTYNSEREHAAKIYELQREADRLHANFEVKKVQLKKGYEAY
jgi:hypothetical protein